MNVLTFFRKAFLLLFVLFAFISYAQTGLNVTYYDGSIQNFNIASSGKLYFSGSNILIQQESSSTATSLPVNIIKKITFTTYALTVQENSSNSSKLVLYPNPSSDFIVIKSSKSGEKFNIKIYSVSGQLIKSGNYISGEAIDVSTLTSGIYIVKANNSTFKLIKK